MRTDSIEIIYEDNHLLGVLKPAGLLVQGDHTGDPTALDLAKAYIKEKHAKPGNVFLGPVHRVDRPVSGVVVFARTSKAASRLAKAFHDRRVGKFYLCVIIGEMPGIEDTIEGHIARDHKRSRLVLPGARGAKLARLKYRVVECSGDFSLVEVDLQTGRHHQIRVQLAGEGTPVVGDVKYGAPEPMPDRSIALHAQRLELPHPVRDDIVIVEAPPPLDVPPWTRFAATIAAGFGPGE